MSDTIAYGGIEVQLLRRGWPRAGGRHPYRKTYRLKPGDAWHDAEVTLDQWEHYVQSDDGPIPVGAAIVRELLDDGAHTAVFTECWGGGCVLMGHDFVCVEVTGKDRVSDTQHAFARIARGLLGEKLDLAVVEWGVDTSDSPPAAGQKD